MSTLNRSVVLVRPKQPFLDGMRLNDREGSADYVYAVLTKDTPAYLLPEHDVECELAAILRKAWPFIFESELSDWLRVPAAWPQERSLKMFLEWFDVQFSSVVRDTCAEPLKVFPQTGEPESPVHGRPASRAPNVR